MFEDIGDVFRWGIVAGLVIKGLMWLLTKWVDSDRDKDASPFPLGKLSDKDKKH